MDSPSQDQGDRVAALYRTVVRIVGVFHGSGVDVVVPAWNSARPVFLRAETVPQWLMGKEVGYRFFARVPIRTEDIQQIRLVDCEEDPRTVAEQEAVLRGLADQPG